MNPSADDMSTLSRAPGWQPAPRPHRRRSMLIASVVVGAAVLVGATVVTTWLVARPPGTAANAQQPPVAAPVTTTIPTMSAVTEAPGTFDDADELVDWLYRVGMPCGERDHVDAPSEATSLIDCGPNVVAAVYEDHAHAVAGFNLLVGAMQQAGNPHVYMAVGANWTVSSDDETWARQAAERLGGEFRSS